MSLLVFVDMFFAAICCIGMIVRGFILSVDMGMGVNVLVFMAMHQISMPVFVSVDVAVLVGMLKSDGIYDHQYGGGNHNDQTDVELDTGPLIEQNHTKDHAQKRGDGIIGAGLGGAQFFLGFDVEIDAQTVGDEAQNEYCQNPEDTGNGFSDHQSNHEAAETGEGALDGGDLNGGLGAEIGAHSLSSERKSGKHPGDHCR